MHVWRRSLWPMLCAGVLALALTFSACGGDDEEEAAGGGGGATQTQERQAEPATLTLGLIPIVDVAPVMIGIERGFFEEENLQVETQFAAGGAAIVPAVTSGEFQVGYSNNVSLVVAQQQGLPVRIVFPGVAEAETEQDAISYIFVAEDSAIEQPSDLADQRIAINTLGNIGEITVKEALSKRGVDPESVQLVEVPFPDMVQTLESGDVDAIWTAEPFSTNAREAGAQPIIASQVVTHPGLAISSYFADAQYLEENPDVMGRFQRAMTKAYEYVNANPDAVREAITDYAQIPEPVAREMHFPQWDPNLNREDIALLSELSVKHGLIEEEPSIDELIAE